MRRSNAFVSFLFSFSALFFSALFAALPSPAADLIPVEDFFRGPLYSSAVMSPQGKYIAVTVRGGRYNRQGLVVLDLANLQKSQAIAGYVDADVVGVQWVNERRLVFRVFDFQSPWADQIGTGLFTVDRDGNEPPRNLIRRLRCEGECLGLELSWLHTLHSVLRDGFDDVLVVRYDLNQHGESRGTTLLRLNTVTGKSRLVSFGGPDNVREWAVDPAGEPRAAYSEYEGKSRLYLKTTADSSWTKAWERATYKEVRGSFSPIAIDAANMLYVADRPDAEDTTSLSRIDMAEKAVQPKALLSLKGYDFDGDLVFGPRGDVLGVRYLTDARGTYWFDSRLKAIQQKIDAALPGLVNEIDCGQCADTRMLLVTSYSDRQPRVYRLFDTKTEKLLAFGQSRPWIKPQQMAHRDMQRVSTRDGLEIPVHVTRPNGVSGPAPAIVYVHGGPFLRGAEWQWYDETQFLASRGYVVIEPEFRGSAGFGYKLFTAGFKQWGLKMQDDIADATRWAVEKGLADPKRICIAGGSYGGYAALMGLARYPELYRCGIDIVGVTDLDLMYTTRWSDASTMWRDYGMPAMVGEQGSKQLADTSPINLAAKITQPLLMAYGGADRRVPIQHGVRMRDALVPHNKNVEWVEYRDEGHGWILESNNVDFWTRVEKFLETNLR